MEQRARRDDGCALDPAHQRVHGHGREAAAAAARLLLQPVRAEHRVLQLTLLRLLLLGSALRVGPVRKKGDVRKLKVDAFPKKKSLKKNPFFSPSRCVIFHKDL